MFLIHANGRMPTNRIAYFVCMVFRMAGKNSPNTGHITPHHVWAYLHADPANDLTTAEHDHIQECEPCFRLYILCLKSKSFGSVLKALGGSRGEGRSASPYFLENTC